MISTLTIIGGGMIAFAIGAYFIHNDRFTKVKHIGSGMIIIKDKQTGKEYMQNKNGNIILIKD